MAATSQVNLSYPKVRDSYSKFVKVLFTDTTAFLATVLPKDAIITGLYVIGHAVSGAVTSAVIGIGSTSAANEIMASYDVKTAATGEGYNPAGAAAVGTAMATKLTADTPVYAKYTGVGGSDSGCPWFVKIEYTIPGSGEDIQM
jgi:hypothetical protein